MLTTTTTQEQQHKNNTTTKQQQQYNNVPVATKQNHCRFYYLTVLFNKYFYLTIFLKLTLFYCIPNFFIANGFVAVGCYSWLLYTKYFVC